VIRYLLPGRGAARGAKRIVMGPFTPISELCVCSRRLIDSTAGGCEVGRIVRWDDPRVLAAPEAFEPLMLRVER
jgi:hypothetical protein